MVAERIFTMELFELGLVHLAKSTYPLMCSQSHWFHFCYLLDARSTSVAGGATEFSWNTLSMYHIFGFAGRWMRFSCYFDSEFNSRAFVERMKHHFHELKALFPELKKTQDQLSQKAKNREFLWVALGHRVEWKLQFFEFEWKLSTGIRPLMLK